MSDPTEYSASPELSALLDALGAPPRPDELRGAADAVASMQAVMAPTGRRLGADVQVTRKRRRIAILTTAGVLLASGAVAAAAGYDPVDRPPDVEAPPAGVPPVSLPDQAAGRRPAATTTSSTTSSTTTGPSTSVEATTTTTIAATTTAVAGVVCADGNHGETVSSVAVATPAGPGHAPPVVAAAQSDCGKSVNDEPTANEQVAPVPAVADDARPADPGPPADSPAITAPGRPADPGPPADRPAITAPGRPADPGPPADSPANTAPGRDPSRQPRSGG